MLSDEMKRYALDLQAPFPAGDIDWRVGSSSSSGKPWAKVLAYITNRAIMNRLDEVFGVFGWKNEFYPWKIGDKEGILCHLSVQVPGTNEWITKVDGAEGTDVEEIKGGLSDAMKRAAVQFGIGRYLYDLGENWAEIVDKGGRYYSKFKDGSSHSWNPPALPKWALPASSPPGLTAAAETPKAPPKPKPIPLPDPNRPKTKPHQTEGVALLAEAVANGPVDVYIEQAATGSVMEAAITSTEPLKSLAEEKRTADIKVRVNKAISRASLCGTRGELERLSDYADELVKKKEIDAEHRDVINKAVKDGIARVERQAASPHNPSNK